LSDQVTKTKSVNLSLESKLKISQAEINSYKTILHDYQTQISEMKVKHNLNEIKNDNSYHHHHHHKQHKENDSTQNRQQQQQQQNKK
jgi:hypothetical protein